MSGPRTSLASFLLERFQRYATNRQPWERKCRRNLAAYRGWLNDIWKIGEGDENRSTTHLGVVKQKVMGLFVIISDVILQGGHLPFALKVQKGWDKREAEFEDPITQLKDIIEDWIEMAQDDRDVLMLLQSICLFGECWGKNIIEDVSQEIMVEADAPPGVDMGFVAPGMQRFRAEEITQSVPSIEYLSPWAMYWDMEARDISKSEMIFQYKMVSAYELRQMIDLPGAIQEEIETAIQEQNALYNITASVSTSSQEPRLNEIVNHAKNIETYECMGLVPERLANEFEARFLKGFDAFPSLIEPGLDKDEERSGHDVPIMALLAGDRVVRFVRIKMTDRPWMRALCEMDIESSMGVGAADNADQLQVVLNGVIRAIEDNMKWTSNGISIENQSSMIQRPNKLAPGLRIETDGQVPLNDVIRFVAPPDVTPGLFQLLQWGLRLVDDDSHQPRLTQGFGDVGSGGATKYEVQIRAEKAQAYSGHVVRNFDVDLIEPAINFKLKYALSHPDLAHLSGPYRVQATGFATFQNRQDRQQKLMQLINLLLSTPDPELHQKYPVVKLFFQLLKAMDIDPDDMERSDAEIAKMQAQVQAAQVAAGSGMGAVPGAGAATQVPPEAPVGVPESTQPTQVPVAN